MKVFNADGRLLHTSPSMVSDVAYDEATWNGVTNVAPSKNAIRDELESHYAAAAHAILDGTVHTDSVADAVTRGSLIYGNATPKWDELVLGAAGTVPRSDGTDLAFGHGAALQDADGDTKIQVEEGADEDKIRMDVAGTEAFYLSDIGVLTLAKQSKARAYRETSVQSIPNETNTRVQLNAENYDEQNELDISLVEGTAENIAGANLKDTGAFTEAAAYYTGRAAWNTTDGTYTTVTGKTDDDTLTLADDIFDNGEGYSLYFSRFTATEAGYYAISGAVTLEMLADKRLNVLFYKNGTTWVAQGGLHSALEHHLGAVISDIQYLAANDYIELYVWHNCGAAVNLRYTTPGRNTYLAIHKVS